MASLSTDARLRARVGALVDRLSTADSSSGSGAVDLALAVCVVEVLVQGEGQATGAVRLVEHWYRHHIAIIVAERLAGTEEVTGPLLAIAHEQAWRHAVVAAAQQSDPSDWTALTVVHEAAAYEYLLGWAAGNYGVPEAEVRAAQTTTGYRKQPR